CHAEKPPRKKWWAIEKLCIADRFAFELVLSSLQFQIPEHHSMTTKQAVTIVSRGLAVYLLFWFLADLTYLPSDLFSFWHHQQMAGSSEWTTYLRDSNRISASLRLLRMVVLFFAVQ